MKYNRRHISAGKRESILSQTAGACFYCGYLATALDHVIPHSYNANDSESNLVPVCDICNSIASNKHFDSLQAKKEYILKERGSLKWRRRLSAMTVTVIQPSIPQRMPKEPTLPKPSKRTKPPKPIREKKRKPATRLKPRKPRLSRQPKTGEPIKSISFGDSFCPACEPARYVDMLNDEEFDALWDACQARRQEDAEQEKYRRMCFDVLGKIWVMKNEHRLSPEQLEEGLAKFRDYSSDFDELKLMVDDHTIVALESD